MRLGVNLLFLKDGRNRGTATYVRELLAELAKIQGLSMVVFRTESLGEWLPSSPGLLHHVCRPLAAGRFGRVLFEQFSLPKLAWKEKCDLLFCPGYLSPIRSRVPTVVTIHDTQFIDIPNYVNRRQALAYRLLLARGARRARRIIAVSDFSRNRIIDAIGIPPEKIRRIYEAPSRQLVDAPKALGKSVLARLGVEKPYLLSVSGPMPHKNLARLVAAWEACHPEVKAKMELVLAGVNAGEAGVRASSSVKCTGFLTDADLGILFGNALAFVHPSLYEGFGLPVLEAMVHRLPVACSTAGSLPEVAGKGAIYFDPTSTESISSAIERLVADDGLRDRLVVEGAINLKRFSWGDCAEQSWAVFQEAVQC